MCWAVDLGLLLHYLVLVTTDQLLIICHYVFDEGRVGGQRPGQRHHDDNTAPVRQPRERGPHPRT